MIPDPDRDGKCRPQLRTSEGVQLGGWDGLVRAAGGNAFVPDGLSAWEVGTGRDPKGKADEDYEKRKRDPFTAGGPFSLP